jgi:hypothetical protein
MSSAVVNDGQLALHYLGDLRARVDGYTVWTDRSFVYASGFFLAKDCWPVYAKSVSENGALVLARIGDTPLDAPVSLKFEFSLLPAKPRNWTVGLAVFTDTAEDNTPRPLLIMPDGRLINWRLGEHDDTVVCLETRRASAIRALVARARALAAGEREGPVVRGRCEAYHPGST